MGQLLTASAVLMCPHGGKVNVIPANARVMAAGDFVLRPSDVFTIAGCTLSSVGTPCVSVQWVVPGLRGRAAGDSVLTTDSVGLCLLATGVPQGPVQVVVAQVRVSGQ